MEKDKVKSLSVLVAFIVMLMGLNSMLFAGELEPTGTPSSTMHTLEEIYNAVTAIEGGSGNTALVGESGQTGCWDSSGAPISCIETGQDGICERVLVGLILGLQKMGTKVQ